MKKNIILLLLLCTVLKTNAQTLFDDNRVNSVYIIMNANDVQTLMTDVFSETYFKATFVYQYATKKDTVSNVGFRLRGNTSRSSAKKSFRVSFNEFESGKKYEGLKKLNFNGSHNDPTMIRERLFYYAWAKAGLPERRASFIRLYINNQYFGIYTQMEEFDKDWCETAFGNNGGNLYKCRYPADLAYLGDDQTKYKKIMHSATERAYDLKTNEAADDYTDLINLCKQLNQPVDANFPTNIEQVLDVNMFLKVLALEVMTGHWDDYAYNKNNYYLYKNNKTNRFQFISYDADNTFGVDWLGQDWATRDIRDWYAPNPEKRPLVSKLLTVDAYNKIYLKQLDSIATYVINPDSIFPYITKIHSLIRPYVAADPFYPLDYGYNLQKFGEGLTKQVDGHTPYGIRPFIGERIRTMRQQNNTIATNDTPKDVVRFQITPNPVSGNTIYINTLENAAQQVQLYSILGQLVGTYKINDTQQPYALTIDFLPKGLYTCVISDSNHTILGQQILVRQ